MRVLLRMLTVSIPIFAMLAIAPGWADDTEVTPHGDVFNVIEKRVHRATTSHEKTQPRQPTRYVPAAIKHPCPAGQTVYTRWVKTRSSWTSSPTVRCVYGPPKAAIKIKPRVTAAMVLRAFRRIPLPHPLAQSQPSTKTLVNFETIFYVDQGPLTRRVRLLGQRITLAIRPARFVWHHGDGSQAVTDTPGAAYPARDITYRYTRADVTVRHSVTITWTARYRVNNGRWRMVPGTVTTNGPASRLRITEAVPVLSGLR